MSHNLKRLPRAHRGGKAEEQAAKSNHKKKPPSRYHRRRPSNLLQAYIRRQRKSVWLETHIWHAKRFHMDRNAWGYQIPIRPTQRGFRAAHRDAVQHCLVEDRSYMVCLELSGAESVLLPALARLSSTALGLTFAFRSAIQSGSEHGLVLYRPDQYPFGCIGPIRFHWRPTTTSLTGATTLFIWTHPSIWSEVNQALKMVLNLRPTGPPPESPSDRPNNVTEWHIQRASSSVQEFSGQQGVKLRVLKDGMVRLRLTGPTSTRLLRTVCRPPPPDWIGDGFSPSFLAKTNQLWERIGEDCLPGQLRPGTLLPIVFLDPRLSRPGIKEKPGAVKQRCNGAEFVAEELATALSASPFWDSAYRQRVSEKKRSDAVLNKRRGETASGLQYLADTKTDLHFDPELDAVIAGLASVKRSGWELTVPAGWAMPLWLSFQMATARAAGMQASAHEDLEAGRAHFPADWPDTAAGSASAADTAAALAQVTFQASAHEDLEAGRAHFPADWPDTAAGSASAADTAAALAQVTFQASAHEDLEAGRAHFPAAGSASAADTAAALAQVTFQASAHEDLEAGRAHFPAAGSASAADTAAALAQVTFQASAHEDLEAGRAHFPADWPDTAAGSASAADTAAALVQDTGAETPEIPHQYYVLRERRLLSQLRDWHRKGRPVSDALLQPHLSSALIPVCLKPTDGGVPKRFAMICLPRPGDLDSISKRKEPGGGLREPRQSKAKEAVKEEEEADGALEDEILLSEEEVVSFDTLIPDQAANKEAKRAAAKRKTRQAYKERLRLRIAAAKSTKADTKDTANSETKTPASSPSKEPSSPKKSASGNKPTTNPRLQSSIASLTCPLDSVSRPIAGFVVRGDVTFRDGKAAGIGYLTLPDFATLCRNKGKEVLFRNTMTSLYRVGRIGIVLDFE